jgi:uncharacterized Zn-binding protein involved in type VI secretion
MTQRAWIRKGDRTTANGVVTSGLETFTLLDQPIAFEGDSISCPACNSTGVIHCVGTRVPTTGPHGREMALEGDICICRCSPPPRLVGSQTHSYTEGNGELAVAPQSVPPQDHQSRLNHFFDEQPELVAPPIEGVPYYVETMDGRTFSGHTGADGLLPRVVTQGEDEYTICWGDEALAKMEGDNA